MGNKLKYLILALVLLIQAHVALAHENEVVHPGLTQRASNLLVTEGYREVSDPYISRTGDCNDIREGSIKEDNLFNILDSCGVTPLSWIEHGYDPINDQGWGWGTGTAKNKAETEFQEAIDAYNSCDKERAYFQLGRVVHLLEDMTLPAHVHSDVHATGDDFENWSSTPETSPHYDSYANGTQIIVSSSLDSHFQALALQTYYASSFGAVLNQSTTTPIDPASELGRMFPGKVHYVPLGLWGVSYWVIDDIGEYEAELANDDWWQCADDPGYYYIENANGDSDIGLVPPEMRIYLENRTSPMGSNSQTILTRWSEVLFPTTVNYSAGLMKFFYDRMHGGVDDRIEPAEPVGLQGRAGNQKANFVWMAPPLDRCGDTLADISSYRVYYSTDLNTLRNYYVPATTLSEELTGLANNKSYFVCVTAVDTNGNESACSDTVTVRPLDARWVHPEGQGPSESYAQIADALSGISDGTTIMVGPGEYYEPELLVGGSQTFLFVPRNIRLQSERGPGETKILGNTILSVADGCSVIGFTIVDENGKGIDCVYGSDLLIANNIFISNMTGIDSGGSGAYGNVADTAVRIYNNVFVGSVSYATGIFGWWNFNSLIDVQNNIFQGTATNVTGISLELCPLVAIKHNDFYGNQTDIASKGYAPLVTDKYTWSPGFMSFSSTDPLASDFRLVQRPVAGNGVDQGAPKLQYKDVNWDMDCDGSGTDLGAYGGPFAYVDNDLPEDPGFGIPDCLEPLAVAGAMVVLKNSVDQPVTLQA